MSDPKGYHQAINISAVNQVTLYNKELNQILLTITEKRDPDIIF